MPATATPPFPVLDADAARERLAAADIACTAPRLAIAQVLLAADTHVNAEDVQARLKARGLRVARATVYNTLRLFTERGLLREVVADPQRRVFDSNLRPHHHVFDVETGEVWDIPLQTIIGAKPAGLAERTADDAGQTAVAAGGASTSTDPAGVPVEVVGVDVVIRVRRRPRQTPRPSAGR